MLGGHFHYYSIANLIVCVLFLAAMIARALYRTFRRDMAVGSKKDSQSLATIHVDVFWCFTSPMTLSVLVGNGLHILVIEHDSERAWMDQLCFNLLDDEKDDGFRWSDRATIWAFQLPLWKYPNQGSPKNQREDTIFAVLYISWHKNCLAIGT